MDAVESSHSVDVAALKLMGSESEGFVQTEAAGKEGDLCQSNRVFALPSSSSEHGNSYFCRKDAMASVKQPELILDKILCGKLGKDYAELSISQGADASEPLNRSGKNHILHGSNNEVRLQRKAGKVSRGSLCSRRQDIAHLKDCVISDDVKDISDKLGSHPKFSLSPEKAQSVKQKNNINSKRLDKRNLKVSMKSKSDSFSIKAGSGNTHSAASAANNFFGGYGLKSDVHDITKLVDDLSLKDLLGGSCKCPSLSKDFIKKEAHENESFLKSIRKACSILQLPRLVQSLNIEADSVSTKKMSPSILSCVSAASGADGDVGDNCMTELSSCNKDSCSKADIHANPLDILLYKPDDISELLALPPPKDLDSLLQEAATKPSLSSKSAPDIRSGKQLSRRASLLPFQWSHSFSGHSKPISDSAKLSASRSSCPGRWSRVRNFVIAPGNGSGSLINLESLTYNQSLVPIKPRMPPSSLDKVWMDVSDTNPQYSWKLSSSATSSKPSFHSVESGGKANFDENGGHCPVILGAAQTLLDLATHSSRQNIIETARWPKKTWQKAMKAKKLKSSANAGEVLTISNLVSGLGSDYPMKNTGGFSSSKRPRLHTNKNKKDVGRSGYRKGPINWSTMQSSQLSPSKLNKDLILETRYSTVGIIKQSCMMPPPAAVPPSDKTWDGQQKVRKVVAMEWRGKERIN